MLVEDLIEKLQELPPRMAVTCEPTLCKEYYPTSALDVIEYWNCVRIIYADPNAPCVNPAVTYNANLQKELEENRKKRYN